MWDLTCTTRHSVADNARFQDWPKTSDLATWQPDLYSDFIEHLPLPEYTRPDGIRNLASMIPLNVNEFDMGPKLLCAYKSLDQWNHGTVKLRTNAVDIVNVLVYASECENKPVRRNPCQSSEWKADLTALFAG